MAETELPSVFVIQVRLDGKCFDACRAEWGSSIAGGSSMCRETSTPIPGPSSVHASETGFGKQGRPRKSKGILPVKVKIEAFDERVKPRSYASRRNEGRRGSKRQKAS
jgi:hypothetical protein